MNLRFWECCVLLARNFDFTKKKSESFLAAYGYDCCLAHPTLSHTPLGAPLNFAGCSWL